MKRFICALFLAVLMVACSPSNPPPSNETITAAQVRMLMHGAGITGYSELINDKEYSLVTVDWIRGPYRDQFNKFLDREELWAYANESNDCDKFSGWARLYAHKLNNETSNHNKRSIAFGEFFYVKAGFENAGPHAINFGLTMDQSNTNKYLIYFFEPQTGETVPLTKAEIDSCLAWIL